MAKKKKNYSCWIISALHVVTVMIVCIYIRQFCVPHPTRWDEQILPTFTNRSVVLSFVHFYCLLQKKIYTCPFYIYLALPNTSVMMQACTCLSPHFRCMERNLCKWHRQAPFLLLHVICGICFEPEPEANELCSKSVCKRPRSSFIFLFWRSGMLLSLGIAGGASALENKRTVRPFLSSSSPHSCSKYFTRSFSCSSSAHFFLNCVYRYSLNFKTPFFLHELEIIDEVIFEAFVLQLFDTCARQTSAYVRPAHKPCAIWPDVLEIIPKLIRTISHAEADVPLPCRVLKLHPAGSLSDLFGFRENLYD